VASLSPLPLAAGVQLLVELPDALHPVPLSPDPATDAVVAEQLVRQIHPGLFDSRGVVLPEAEPIYANAVERYTVTTALRRDSGAIVTALCAVLLDDDYTASVLTINAVDLAFEEPEVAIGAIREVLLAEGPPDAEIMHLALPAGPAVGRVRHRTLRAGVDPVGDAQRLEVGVADIHVAIPGANVLLVLDLFCPTVATFEQHAAMLGGVARSVAVTVSRAEGAA
jgi:hypothetical protein